MLTCIFENGDKTSLRHVVVDAIVVKESRILLVKRAATLKNNPNKWALPGGYVGRDETIKEAVLRELKEETGYAGKIVRLFLINDSPKRKGDDKQNVSFIFLINPLKKIAKSDHEVSEVKWFDLNRRPPEKEFAFDHFDIIKLYFEYLKNPCSVPVLSSLKH